MDLPSIPDPSVLRRGRRGILALLLVLSGMGACGLSGSVGTLASPVPQFEERAADATGDGEQLGRRLVEALWESPARRPLSVANLLLSALLLVASGSWALLRGSAPWWTRQAAVANALWTVADAVHQGWTVLSHRDELMPLLQAELRARVGPEELARTGASGDHVLYGYVAFAAMWGLLRVGVYLWALRRSRAPDVLAALRAFGASRR